jgi:hypothetical protein
MNKFYKDFNSHVAMVYQSDSKMTLAITSKADGLRCVAMSTSQFRRTFTRPFEADPRTAARKWFCRALSKTRNDPRALQIIGEIFMTDTNEMTMDELVEHYNEIAAELGKPTVETFKSLKAGRTALAKLTKPAEPKAAKTPKEPKEIDPNAPRGPVQGVGAFAKALLLEGMSNKDAHAKVIEQFPTAKTSVACIAYYRSKLVAAGQLVSARKTKEAANEEIAAA